MGELSPVLTALSRGAFHLTHQSYSHRPVGTVQFSVQAVKPKGHLSYREARTYVMFT